MSVSETQIAWLAGLIDGEGCVHLALHHGKVGITARVEIRMTCQETINRAAEIIAALVREPPNRSHQYYKRESDWGTRVQWSLYVTKKSTVQCLLESLLPYLITKRLEAGVVLIYLSRACRVKQYRATEYDHMLRKLCSALKHGCGEAQADAEEILRASQVIPSQAGEGAAKAAGSPEGVQASDPSPNGNDRHECPAPLRLVAGR